MSKLFKLKEWLTIEDACKRLSVIFEEEVGTKDLIQLVIEEKINVSYYFTLDEFISAIEVVKDNVYLLDSVNGEEFLSTNKPLSYITRAQANIPEGEAFRVYIDNNIDRIHFGIYRDYRAIGLKFTLDGAYNIDINTGNIKSILENMFFEKEPWFEREYISGLIVKDENGSLYKLISDFDDNDGLPVWSIPPYSIDLEPKLSDLVILRTDIEKFEQSFVEAKPEQSKNLRTPTESLTMSLGVMTEILSKKIEQINKTKKLNFSQLSKEIEQEAARLGLELTEISNLQRDLSKAHKIIKERTN